MFLYTWKGGDVRGKSLIALSSVLALIFIGYRYLPSYYNPFAPLQLNDPPGRITQYKLRRLSPQACSALLTEANQQQVISARPVADSQGDCPLSNVVRVRDFGAVKLNSSFWRAARWRSVRRCLCSNKHDRSLSA